MIRTVLVVALAVIVCSCGQNPTAEALGSQFYSNARAVSLDEVRGSLLKITKAKDVERVLSALKELGYQDRQRLLNLDSWTPAMVDQLAVFTAKKSQEAFENAMNHYDEMVAQGKIQPGKDGAWVYDDGMTIISHTVGYEFHDNPNAVYNWSEPVYTPANTSPEVKK